MIRQPIAPMRSLPLSAPAFAEIFTNADWHDDEQTVLADEPAILSDIAAA